MYDWVKNVLRKSSWQFLSVFGTTWQCTGHSTKGATHGSSRRALWTLHFCQIFADGELLKGPLRKEFRIASFVECFI